MNKSLWRTLFGSILLSSILAILDLCNLAIDKGFSLTQPKWFVLVLVIGFLGILALVFFSLTWTKSFKKLQVSYNVFLSYVEKLKWLFLIFFIVSLSFLPFLVLHPYIGSLLKGRLWIKIFIFLILSFVGASLLRVARITLKKENEEISWIEYVLFAAFAQLLVYQLVLASLYITDYPFALGWTRDSRYYYASLFFSERIYGQKIPLPILHPTLHFIFSFPYLFGKLPLWIHRAWSVILTFGLTGAVSAVLSKKISVNPPPQSPPQAEGMPRRGGGGILFALWAFLFLVQGSIYAHLLIPALIIFIFVSPENLKRSWAAIIIASLWAGMSRINWFPVPAMLAALIYFLEPSSKGFSPYLARRERAKALTTRGMEFLRYFAVPAAWFFAGIASAFFSQTAYIRFSGNGARDEFFTSLASDLLWYRLLPSNTYAPGILWGAIFLSAPLLGLLFYARKNWNSFQKLGIFSILFILFLGGLVVSVKIGGGADLHNMDAYFVSILLVGTTVLAREFRLDSVSKHLRGEMLFSATLILAWFILRGGGSTGYDQVATYAALNDLQAQSTRVAAQGDEVLFVSQRHLLAVGLIEDIPLVSEYEKDVLMEMVMSRNRAYLDGFHDDLRHQRFGLIVIDPQTDTLLSEERSFAPENNIWILKVTRPLWCYYEPLILYESVGVELYTPRAEPMDCD